ncbi:unnamed protein product [Rhizoctonia solani]|uniref:Uncharacterized protein n=1 Tax=Rhizoctonia solani TaxID=456999 RepID=A0A8H3HKJ3_9AGAM|nr:unnamed protein product [Rhizoctonia solani]
MPFSLLCPRIGRISSTDREKTRLTYLEHRGGEQLLIDPFLGIATGLLAYHLHETNPRTAPPEGEDLRTLIRWRQSMARSRELAEMAQWNNMMEQLNLNDDVPSEAVTPAASGVNN